MSAGIMTALDAGHPYHISKPRRSILKAPSIPLIDHLDSAAHFGVMQFEFSRAKPKRIGRRQTVVQIFEDIDEHISLRHEEPPAKPADLTRSTLFSRPARRGIIAPSKKNDANLEPSDSAPRLLTAHEHSRTSRVIALDAAPRRLPLQAARNTAANVQAGDVNGSDTGKENDVPSSKELSFCKTVVKTIRPVQHVMHTSMKDEVQSKPRVASNTRRPLPRVPMLVSSEPTSKGSNPAIECRRAYIGGITPQHSTKTTSSQSSITATPRRLPTVKRDSRLPMPVTSQVSVKSNDAHLAKTSEGARSATCGTSESAAEAGHDTRKDGTQDLAIEMILQSDLTDEHVSSKVRVNVSALPVCSCALPSYLEKDMNKNNGNASLHRHAVYKVQMFIQPFRPSQSFLETHADHQRIVRTLTSLFVSTATGDETMSQKHALERTAVLSPNQLFRWYICLTKFDVRSAAGRLIAAYRRAV